METKIGLNIRYDSKSLVDKYKEQSDEEQRLKEEQRLNEELKDFLQRKRGPKSFLPLEPTLEELHLFAKELLERKEAEASGKEYKPKIYYKEEQEELGMQEFLKGLLAFITSRFAVHIFVISCIILTIFTKEHFTFWTGILIFFFSVFIVIVVYLIKTCIISEFEDD